MLLQEYNILHAATTGVHNDILSLPDVLDSNKLVEILNPKFYRYSKEKQELIEAYLLLCRSTEELELLKCDMHNAILYYHNRIEVLTTAIDNPQDVAHQFKRGARTLLLDLKLHAEQELAKLRQLTSPLSNEHQSTYQESGSDLSSDDEETDCDSD